MVEAGEHPGEALFAAADVHYLRSGGARAAAVVAADPAFSRLVGERIAMVADVAPYQPGQFYLRELPPLRAVLDGLSGLGLLVLDGYADLDPDGQPGLGARAHQAFGVPVIGVAKTPFRTATHAIEVLRGTSARPLYVTAAGMPQGDAAELVRQMAGQHRLPDALRRADTLARRGLPQPLVRLPVSQVCKVLVVEVQRGCGVADRCGAAGADQREDVRGLCPEPGKQDAVDRYAATVGDRQRGFWRGA